MKQENKHTDRCNCNQGALSVEEITLVVDAVVKETGTGKDKVIQVLQKVQKRLNYLPSEALKYICRVTEITPGQISGVSTFYSQFRHIPSGKHTIKICSGTACHVKGSELIADAFRRDLKISEEKNSSPDNLFSIEEVACLGCCTLAPVVQIDEKTYGHVKPTQVKEIVTDFLQSVSKKSKKKEEPEQESYDAEVRIGLGSCCVAGGSRDILGKLLDIREYYDLNINVKPVGCVGVCNQTPLLEIVSGDKVSSRYTNVRKDQVEEIILKHIQPKSFDKKLKFRINNIADTFLSDDMVYSPVNLPTDTRERTLNNFLSKQLHIATLNGGVMRPDSYDEYELLGGYNALKTVLTENNPAGVISLITASGLRGRGGAGFLTGKKWEISSAMKEKPKYVVCNGDEGDPGAFMDRMILESFPFRIIEGMLIAGFATGADRGIFYIRDEYPLAVSRVKNALKICKEKGIVGNNIMRSGFSFSIEVFEGAGAFVCGEETALIASLEGKRGTPHLRPPYPAVKGYKGYPTLVNNVETLSLVPWIINNGSAEFNDIGTEKSKGTKVFALAGKVARGGLIEVPMGTTIRDIVEKIGHGVLEGRTFKAVQIGGPSGGCIPERLADTAVDYEELNRLGAMMGSGGMVVLDDTDCMVDMAKYFLEFTHKQSCGKCTYCRVGTKHMLDILTRLTQGKATIAELDELEQLCLDIKKGSLCGLGKTAPNPVITGLRYFREEYEAHTRGICPSKRCRDLVKYSISDKCTGCTKCAQDCPVDAIPFTPYEKHVIDYSLCTKCDNCRVVCPENAIELVYEKDENQN
ncbi:MAG TPA: NAD(P)H-dependent oxidoreductase subunit E [Bacteroidales bacterium]|nr:NAD(P)H-dependent oxidoreductase subunit E [Bacteroidales bacterium]HOG56462.1 NAD(P)H-dependent oxidoreductase subunit E [Bacteroidales bacterium]HPB12578.1 NAD(P)H-dependent oxidoreductase subunit E [Bacteroidales bacterium]HPX43080.1 NAD(P)H-dependent oxidoreductase subunit E [Bacteroidales bacterium]HQB86094.1 NAD(P)H-dependent oxidoreductase subunit E [Bacteroidales bacterium]